MMPRTLVWTGAVSGDFALAGNWNDPADGLSPAAAPPGVADTASITTAATITGQGAALSVTLAGAPVLAGSVSLAAVGRIAGTATIASGGVLDATRLVMASGATLALAPGAAVALTGSLGVSPAALDLGVASADAGVSVQVAGGRLVAVPGGIVVGDAGGGALAVTAGGTVMAAGANTLLPSLQIGAQDGGQGSVTLDDTASVLDSAGEVDVGVFGAGTLAITDAATLAVTGTLPNALPGIAIGDDVASATGTVFVTGTHALLDAGSGRISVGNIGSGTLLVGQGATVLASAAGYTQNEEALHLGYYAGGQGAVTIDGAGSSLDADGAVLVGNDGSGTLQVSNSAHLSAGGARDGGVGLAVNGAGGSGTVTVMGGTVAVADAVQVNAAGGIAVSGGGSVAIAGALLLGGGSIGIDNASGIAVGGGSAAPGAISVAKGGQIGGYGVIAGAVQLGGFVTASGGTLEIAGSVTGTGTLAINDNATLKLDWAAVGPAVGFAGVGGTLELATPSLMVGPVNGLAAGDAILLADAIGATASSASANGTTTVDFTINGADLGTLALPGAPTLAFDSTTGVLTACFAAGTRIATDRGAVAVERLRVGDRVVLARDPSRTRPVRWIGWRRCALAGHPRPQDVWPVRVAAHAFGPGQPSRDLVLSPEHAVLAGGVLIPVRYLLNGASVVQERAARVTYYHVELDRHDVLLAEGLACESYLDTGNRDGFAHQVGTNALRAGGRPRPCLKLVKHGPAVRAARAALLARLLPLGFRVTADAGLALLADGRAVPLRRDGAWHTARLPPEARRLLLRSRRTCPADLDPESEDRRRLGVPLLAWRLGGATMTLDDPRLGRGWLPPEGGLRWSDGDAAIDVRGAAEVALQLGDWPRYLL